MANEQNLRPGEHKLTVEDAKRGGKKSGEVRKRKADLRKLAQSLLDGTYTDRNGVNVTGEELFLQTLIANLANPNGRNWGKAADILIELTGAKRTAEDKARIKAETELIKVKAKQMTGGDVRDVPDDGFLAALNGSAVTDWSETDAEE